MSGSRGDAVSTLAASIDEEVRRYQNQPLHKKNEERAMYGAFLVTCGGYAVATLGIGIIAAHPWLIGGGTGFGLLLLIVGVLGERGPVDPMTVIGALAVPVGGWFLIQWWPALWASYYGRDFCLAVLASCAVRLWMALSGVRGDARALVAEDIAEHEFTWE